MIVDLQARYNLGQLFHLEEPRLELVLLVVNVLNSTEPTQLSDTNTAGATNRFGTAVSRQPPLQADSCCAFATDLEPDMPSALRAALAVLLLAAGGCFAPTPAPGSATQDAPPYFAPFDGGADAGPRPDAGGVDAGPADAGASDAGTPGLTIVSSNNRLPPPWAADAPQLGRLQPLDGGTPALQYVSQLVRLRTPTTSDNTIVDDDHCPNIYMGACDGFAADAGPGALVLVDGYALLGSGQGACSALFNGVAFPAITGVWQGKLSSTTMLTSYSLALTSCADLGQGAPYAGSSWAPASVDVQLLQASYPTDGRLVTVSGVVVGVAQNQTKLRSMFIEDPGGGPLSGIQVYQGSGLTPVPAVGDYVKVTAQATVRGDYRQLVLP